MKKRDRRLTPTSTILAAASTAIELSWDEAVHREGMELKADTPSISTDGTISAKSVLVGEGSSKDSKESMDTARIISKQDSRENFELNRNMKIKKKNNYRVPVQYPDGKPGMPTSNKKANRLLKEGKAEIIKNKLNIFAIKLKFWPIYRELQPIILLIDPGSTFTGIAVMSKSCIDISYMLELPGYKNHLL